MQPHEKSGIRHITFQRAPGAPLHSGLAGADAECILLYNSSDVTTAKFLINNSSDNEELDPAERETIRRQDLERLAMMVGYCKTKECLRGKLAREAGIPAYVVFSNATLQDMARKKPRTMTDFRRVSGVGELKAAWYGKVFLERIREYLDSQ